MSNIGNPVSGQARAGLLALMAYGMAVFSSTLTHQPDPSSDFRAYAEYVTTPSFLVSHLAGSIAGTTIGILGLLALYAALPSPDRRRWIAVAALATSVSGLSLVMTLFGAAAYAQPAIGRAYLAGDQGAIQINSDIYGPVAISVGVLGGVLYSLGGILFGVAIWRSGRLPKWTGEAYAIAVPLLSLVGLVVGAAQTLAAVLLTTAAAGITHAALRPASTPSPILPTG
jgi:hypothetical protein